MFVVCVLCCDVVLCTYRLQAGEFKLSPELVALVLSWLERVGAFDEDWIRRFVGLLLRRLVALLACWLCTLWLNSVSRISFLLPLLLTPSQIMSGCLDLDGSQWLVVRVPSVAACRCSANVCCRLLEAVEIVVGNVTCGLDVCVSLHVEGCF